MHILGPAIVMTGADSNLHGIAKNQDLNEEILSGSRKKPALIIPVLFDPRGHSRSVWYLIQNGEILLKESVDEVDGSDAKTISDFLGWPERINMGQIQSFVLWGHGNPWGSYGFDETSRKGLDENGLVNLICMHPSLKEVYLDMCYGAKLSTLSRIAQCSENISLIAAACNEIHVDGADYNHFLANYNLDDSPEKHGKIWIKSFQTPAHTEVKSQMAAFDASKIRSLHVNIEELYGLRRRKTILNQCKSFFVNSRLRRKMASTVFASVGLKRNQPAFYI